MDNNFSRFTLRVKPILLEKLGYIAEFFHPSPIFCTDNAAMIGVAAYYEYISGKRSGLELNAVPNLKLGER